MNQAKMNIIIRSYLVDPEATERDLLATGNAALACQLKADYQVGRLQDNFETLTGKKVEVHVIPKTQTVGGAVMSPSEESRH